jgi:hypothetical protein
VSYYINGYAVLSAIKAVLDADSTLDTLLKVAPNRSKVILGVERPRESNLPTIHLSVLTRNINTETKLNRLLIRVAWFVNALPTSGAEDVESLANIGERIYDLLDDTTLTVSGYRVHFFTAESGEGVGKDVIQPEGLDNHFDSLIFAMNVVRTA